MRRIFLKQGKRKKICSKTNNNLLVLTTGGLTQYLYDAVKTLKDSMDVLVVDDGTPAKKKLAKFCEEKKIHFITKDKPKGLTHSWNLAYQFFVKEGYDGCILSNDDVRFQKGFSRDLLRGVKKFDIVCPISNKPTSRGKWWKKQWLFRYCSISPTRKKANRESIQHFLEKKFRKSPYEEAREFNGFCFAFGKRVERFRYSESCLFNKKTINTKNEVLLAKHIRGKDGKIAVCKTSYVYHYKGVTFRELGLANKNLLWSSSKNKKLLNNVP